MNNNFPNIFRLYLGIIIHLVMIILTSIISMVGFFIIRLGINFIIN